MKGIRTLGWICNQMSERKGKGDVRCRCLLTLLLLAYIYLLVASCDLGNYIKVAVAMFYPSGSRGRFILLLALAL